MNTTVLKPSRLIFLLAISLLAFAGSACQRVDTNANTNTSLTANANTAIANANLSPGPATVGTAREPEKYRAVLVFSAETDSNCPMGPI